VVTRRKSNEAKCSDGARLRAAEIVNSRIDADQCGRAEKELSKGATSDEKSEMFLE
jgi:hypothetical protein